MPEEQPTAVTELTGYSDRLSVRAGETIRFHTSTDAAAHALRIVRLLHGDESPAGPGRREQDVDAAVPASVPGRLQRAHAGSYGVAEGVGALLGAGAATLALHVWPTTPAAGREQGLMAIGPPAGGGLALRLDAHGRVTLHAGDAPDPLVRGPRLRERAWYRVAGGVDTAAGVARLVVEPLDPLGADAPAALAADVAIALGPLDDARLLLAAARVTPDGAPAGLYNGKLEAPCVHAGLPGEDGELLACWDFALAPGGARLHELIGARHGTLANMPARAMTGHRWRGATSPAEAPEEHAAIHFHEDDLDDARWEATAAWQVPAELPSGVYAARLDAGGLVDHLPFVVRPATGSPAAHALVLMSTFTYLAYANERLLDVAQALGLIDDAATAGGPADALLRRHPEYGRSLYDTHTDGSGCCYSSLRRPIPNLRPGYRFWLTGCPERFPSDLYLVDWLEREGVAADYATDHDLHADGLALLASYRVVLLPSHPEYWSAQMLDALEAYLTGGGRVMYLGGNGLYWVTSVTPEGHAIEVRRGHAGTRCWESAPGETHHSMTGEQGGLWRHRGRAPNRLLGLGFTAQSDEPSRAAGYVRCPDSFDPEVAFIFDGVGADEVIGEFGLINGGAAGYEIDRCDPALGAPGRTWRLATSQGRHDDSYLLAVEEQLAAGTAVTASTCEQVRADVVYARTGGGGEVFGVGSCNWLGSLSHAGGDNNVSRITRNVLGRMLRR